MEKNFLLKIYKLEAWRAQSLVFPSPIPYVTPEASQESLGIWSTTILALFLE